MAHDTGLLYNFHLSFAAQRARLALEEKKIPYKTKNVNLLVGDNFSASYLKLNPNATIPTFVKGDLVITDSLELLKYADSIGDPLGGDKVSRAKVEEWIAKLTKWDDNLATYAQQGEAQAVPFLGFRVKVLEARKKSHPEFADAYAKKIAGVKKMIEDVKSPEAIKANDDLLVTLLDESAAQLSTSPFLAGEAFSMADVVLMNALNRVEVIGKKDDIETRAPLAKFWSAAKERPSYAKVVKPTHGLGTPLSIIGAISNITIRKTFGLY
eukprot:TRINITY_DN23456_c0_g1_i1.p1 TRINITY_DN23456_c0_g1~~TRINITY_DN23456_c0_g1_i1.p1  ORF type:complete len:268 (+),score=72.61 TRINITY_DN23456_c0_g1_i1:236-1039(+)